MEKRRMTWRDDMEAFSTEFSRVIGDARAVRIFVFALLGTMCLALLLDACSPKIYLVSENKLKKVPHE